MKDSRRFTLKGHSDTKGKDDKGEAFQGWNSRERWTSQGRPDGLAWMEAAGGGVRAGESLVVGGSSCQARGTH